MAQRTRLEKLQDILTDPSNKEAQLQAAQEMASTKAGLAHLDTLCAIQQEGHLPHVPDLEPIIAAANVPSNNVGKIYIHKPNEIGVGLTD